MPCHFLCLTALTYCTASRANLVVTKGHHIRHFLFVPHGRKQTGPTSVERLGFNMHTIVYTICKTRGKTLNKDYRLNRGRVYSTCPRITLRFNTNRKGTFSGSLNELFLELVDLIISYVGKENKTVMR